MTDCTPVADTPAALVQKARKEAPDMSCSSAMKCTPGRAWLSTMVQLAGSKSECSQVQWAWRMA